MWFFVFISFMWWANYETWRKYILILGNIFSCWIIFCRIFYQFPFGKLSQNDLDQLITILYRKYDQYSQENSMAAFLLSFNEKEETKKLINSKFKINRKVRENLEWRCYELINLIAHDAVIYCTRALILSRSMVIHEER